MPQNTPNIPPCVSLDRVGIASLNELQNQSLQLHKQHSNIALLAQTGSGKTIAYLLPAIERLDAKRKALQCVVVAPARELALQIESVFKTLQTGMKISCLYGGHNIQTEKKSLQEQPHIVVGTPGRLAYHFRNGALKGLAISQVIFDEFDKVLEFGYLADVEEMYSHLPSIQCHTFTSATELGALPTFLRCPNVKTVDFRNNHQPLLLRYYTVRAEDRDKLSALHLLLCNLQDKASVIFCNHRDAVDRISTLLKDSGIAHERFHGGMLQNLRELALAKFRNGSSRILLTTDLASRGLDIPLIDSVIHYQLPPDEQSHTHRNGRTARMNANGSIFYILAKDDWMPEYIDADIHEFTMKQSMPLPPVPQWISLFVSLGRKDKIGKGDIMGFFCKKGNISKEQIGQIELKDNATIVAVSRNIATKLISALKNERIKNKKVSVSKAK